MTIVPSSVTGLAKLLICPTVVSYSVSIVLIFMLILLLVIYLPVSVTHQGTLQGAGVRRPGTVTQPHPGSLSFDSLPDA